MTPTEVYVRYDVRMRPAGKYPPRRVARSKYLKVKTWHGCASAEAPRPQQQRNVVTMSRILSKTYHQSITVRYVKELSIWTISSLEVIFWSTHATRHTPWHTRCIFCTHTRQLDVCTPCASDPRGSHSQHHERCCSRAFPAVLPYTALQLVRCRLAADQEYGRLTADYYLSPRATGVRSNPVYLFSDLSPRSDQRTKSARTGLGRGRPRSDR